MPVDESHRYFIRGSFQNRTISRMSRSSYPYARNSSRFQPTPYPSTRSMMLRNDADGNDWFRDAGEDLHLSDFVFLARMQTARRMSQRVSRFPQRDLVLERLLAEGTFDRVRDNPLHAGEAFAMNHASAMVNRILMRVEKLEDDVSANSRAFSTLDIDRGLIAGSRSLRRDCASIGVGFPTRRLVPLSGGSH
jgi:hypothetical protein